ncbi:MAG: urease accessory protein UreF [Acidimicrobiaceae bacterium]|nr:urease accessory protein UreF [Acidimicrobiaceae bacterium]
MTGPTPKGPRGGATLLLLADGRFPAGGHIHSGGVEEAVTDGRIAGLDDLRRYLEGRLWTTGAVDAALAVAAWHLADRHTVVESPNSGAWSGLDAEAAARMPSAALRRASRTQGRGLLRAARRLWPAPWVEDLAGIHPDGPIWAPALGAAARAGGLEAADAALVASQSAVTGPAWAAVRLLGLDPFSVASLLAELAHSVDTHAANASAAPAGTDLTRLPALSGPLTDVAAEVHASREVRLFAS